jgi:V/A-type H+/Na+-transporting ATPase subunit E
MPLKELLHAIEIEADEERLIADRAKTEAATTVVERARREAVVLEADILRAHEVEADREADHMRSLARLDAASTVRAACEEAFASLLSLIRKELIATRDSETYPQLFRMLLTESQAALPSATELRIDPRDAALAAPLADGLRIIATLETSGGVELVSQDGRSIRNTLEERLANSEIVLRRRFAGWLATPPGAGLGESRELAR